jgi:hypothetical protein
MDSHERRQARRKRFEHLREIQQRIVQDWMDTNAETWVSSVGIDEQVGVVTVSLNRRDQQYIDRLVATFGDDVHIGSETVNVAPVPIGPVPASPRRQQPF